MARDDAEPVVTPPDVHPILVIGGGPAGLSIAYELSRRGVPAPILERADAPGDSWRRMPRHMNMNSPIGASPWPRR